MQYEKEETVLTKVIREICHPITGRQCFPHVIRETGWGAIPPLSGRLSQKHRDPPVVEDLDA